MWDIEIVKSGSEYYVYQHSPESRSYKHFPEVVARFKYANPGRSARHFVKFLTKTMTPNAYFAERAKNLAPVTILEQYGFVSYNKMRCSKLAAVQVV